MSITKTFKFKIETSKKKLKPINSKISGAEK